jgi:hypothetical protein
MRYVIIAASFAMLGFGGGIVTWDKVNISGAAKPRLEDWERRELNRFVKQLDRAHKRTNRKD